MKQPDTISPSPVDFLRHVVDYHEVNITRLEQAYVLVEQMSKDHYAFQIADAMCDNSAKGVDLFPVECIDSITRLVALFMKDQGYNHRKKVGVDRERDVHYKSTKEYVDIAIQALSHKHRAELREIVKEQTTCIMCGTFINVENIPFGDTYYHVCTKCLPDVGTPTAITKIFTFAAAHHLPYHEGLCRFTHGHEWRLEMSVERPTHPETQMVIDFSDLKKIVNKTIVDQLDHNYVNDLIYNPTAENICVWVWERLADAGLVGISQIRLWEAPSSFAVVTKKNIEG